MQQLSPERVFKSAWFSKAVRKAHISDRDLCRAVGQVMKGQVVDLGGRVFNRAYAKLTTAALNQLIQDQELMEICHDHQT